MSATEQSIEQNGGGGADLFERIVLVDEMFGNDATAIPYDQNKPFKTINSARTASVSGDTIVVNAGNYTLTSQLAKNKVNYYFHPNAIVIHNGVWVLDDTGHVGVANTKIFGFGQFKQTFTFSFGVVNLSVATTEFYFEFDRILGDSGANFAGTAGTCTIRGKYIRNNLQYIVQGYNTCVWNFKVDKIDNINIGGASFIFILLTEAIIGQGSKSIFECDLLTNNATGSFGTITHIDSLETHKVCFKGNIVHKVIGPAFLSAVCSVTRGGIIEFEGYATTTVRMAIIYGDNNFFHKDSILIKNSICKQIVDAGNSAMIHVANEFNWITIKDSIIIGTTPDTCEVGVLTTGGDDEYGNLEISNSVIRNIFDDLITPVSVIKSNKIRGVILLDDAILEIKTLVGGSYSVVSQGAYLPQKVSILSGGATSTNDFEPLNILNTMAGPSLVLPTFGTQELTNPHIN